MSKEELIFCPLGGSGEIGGNMNLYAYGKEDNQKWIIVDMGVSFADDSVPGIDIIMPDAGFIIDKKDDLLGIILPTLMKITLDQLLLIFGSQNVRCMPLPLQRH